MKVIELYNYLNHSLKLHPENKDSEVVIKINKPSIGGCACCKVSSCSFGFDWDKGKFILEPELNLVRKTEDETLWDAAREILLQLYSEAFKRKRKPWYFERIKNIYIKLGILDMVNKQTFLFS
jgi:hypothetical protein